jgi:hypothetical protein
VNEGIAVTQSLGQVQPISGERLRRVTHPLVRNHRAHGCTLEGRWSEQVDLGPGGHEVQKHVFPDETTGAGDSDSHAS